MAGDMDWQKSASEAAKVAEREYQSMDSVDELKHVGMVASAYFKHVPLEVYADKKGRIVHDNTPVHRHLLSWSYGRYCPCRCCLRVRPLASESLMSILDKHPGPWALFKPAEPSGYCEENGIVDSNGVCVVFGETVELDSGCEVQAGVEVEPDVLRLILTAPEMLAALKSMVSIWDTGATNRPETSMQMELCAISARAIIDRIEGGWE